jgi:hypothetical protein
MKDGTKLLPNCRVFVAVRVHNPGRLLLQNFKRQVPAAMPPCRELLTNTMDKVSIGSWCSSLRRDAFCQVVVELVTTRCVVA